MTERVDFYVLKNAGARARHLFACRLAEKAYLKQLGVALLVAWLLVPLLVPLPLGSTSSPVA